VVVESVEGAASVDVDATSEVVGAGDVATEVGGGVLDGGGGVDGDTADVGPGVALLSSLQAARAMGAYRVRMTAKANRVLIGCPL